MRSNDQLFLFDVFLFFIFVIACAEHFFDKRIDYFVFCLTYMYVDDIVEM